MMRRSSVRRAVVRRKRTAKVVTVLKVPKRNLNSSIRRSLLVVISRMLIKKIASLALIANLAVSNRLVSRRQLRRNAQLVKTIASPAPIVSLVVSSLHAHRSPVRESVLLPQRNAQLVKMTASSPAPIVSLVVSSLHARRSPVRESVLLS